MTKKPRKWSRPWWLAVADEIRGLGHAVGFTPEPARGCLVFPPAGDWVLKCYRSYSRPKYVFCRRRLPKSRRTMEGWYVETNRLPTRAIAAALVMQYLRARAEARA